jgi:hypothetical protein
MATRRYKISAGEQIKDVVEEVGAATDSDTVELTVDLAATAVNAASGQRQISKAEFLAALDKIKYHVQKGAWPPA